MRKMLEWLRRLKRRLTSVPADDLITADFIIDGRFVSQARFAAGRYIRCCPYHFERTASFIIDPKTRRYRCFGCEKTGTATLV